MFSIIYTLSVHLQNVIISEIGNSYVPLGECGICG
jgi:hypothetical protein